MPPDYQQFFENIRTLLKRRDQGELDDSALIDALRALFTSEKRKLME